MIGTQGKAMWPRVSLERQGKQAVGSDGCPPREGSRWKWHARNIQSEVFVVGIRRKSSSSCISASCGKSIGLSGKLQHLDMAWEAKVKTNPCQTLTLCTADSVVDLCEPWSHVCICLSEGAWMCQVWRG